MLFETVVISLMIILGISVLGNVIVKIMKAKNGKD